ncbi:MAG: acyl-CoA thioesterase [Bacteriovoracaceae bacterium]
MSKKVEAAEFQYKVQIKEQYLDTFGHVNNAAYLTLFEEARWDFITENGYGIKDIQKNKQGPVVLDVSIRFKRELKNREVINIHSQTESLSGKIMKMNQKMINARGEIASEAHFTFGFMDMEKRKLVNPPASWLKAVGVKEGLD